MVSLPYSRFAVSMLLAALLAACTTTPRSGNNEPLPTVKPARPGGDSAPATPPADLANTPDAEPRVEPIRPGGPNKPYAVLGQSYEPQTSDTAWKERGLASWYGSKFHGRRTASGELYNMYGMSAAHRTLPIPSYARVRNPANGREVVVRVNDRGPFHSNRILDLSYTAALKLGMLGQGSATIELERLTFDDIRTGAWKRPGDAATAVSTLPAGPPVAAAKATDVDGGGDPLAVFAASGPDDIATAASTPTAASATAEQPPLPAPAVAEERRTAYTTPAQGFWVQLGTFTRRQGAEDFQKRVAAELDSLGPLLAVFSEAARFRLQVGPYPSREEARKVAQRVREALQLVPLIVERR